MEQKAETTRLIAEVISNPSLLSNPDVMQKIERLEVAKATETSTALDAARAAVALSTYGNNPVTTPPAFSPAAVAQQITRMAESYSSPSSTGSSSASTPTTTTTTQSPVSDKVTQSNLESIAKVIERMNPDPVTGKPANPPTIAENIVTVQQINQLIQDGKLPAEALNKLQEIKDKIIATLPPQVRQEQKQTLQGCSGSPCNCHATPAQAAVAKRDATLLNGGKEFTKDKEGNLLVKNDKGEITQRITPEEQEKYAEQSKAVIEKFTPRVDVAYENKIIEALRKETAHICGDGCGHGATPAPKITQSEIVNVAKAQAVNNVDAKSVDFSTFSQDAGKSNSSWSVPEPQNDNNLFGRGTKMKEAFKIACDGNCGACGKCKPPEPQKVALRRSFTFYLYRRQLKK